MKLKNAILGVGVVVIILVGQVFLFSANRQKETAQVKLREANIKVEQLQSQLDQLKSSSVATLSANNAQLRKDNQVLLRKNSQLQKENAQLRGASQKLTQQLQTVHDTVQEQEEQLQEMQMETCINNLRQIDAAKQQWALENEKDTDAVPAAEDLQPYLKDGIFPVCPSGGTYTINAVGYDPGCSISGHTLPQ